MSLPSRPMSQPVPYALHYPLEDDADGVSLARTISKDSLASSLSSATPKHLLRSGHQHRLSGQSLLSHVHIEDEVEEVEEEELVAVIHPSALPCRRRRRLGSDMEQDELEVQSGVATPTKSVIRSPCPADGYYLEPLMPTTPRTAKEKSISLNKEEESGESHSRGARKAPSGSQRKSSESSGSTPEAESFRPPTEGSLSWSGHKQPQGFYLHLSEEAELHSSFSAGMEVGLDSDSDIADLEEDEEDEDPSVEQLRRGRGRPVAIEFGEGESAKLRDDLKVSERDDKEDCCSGRSSPCLSTASWASSCSASGGAGVRMTSFAERKLLKLGLREGFSSASSSQKTTPDGSEAAACPPWQLKSDSGRTLKEPFLLASPSAVPAELLQLHMQLEEQRRAIEHQKKKVETLSARQRLKLGKAAFLNIVKKGGGGGRSDTLPLPIKHSESAELAERRKAKVPSCRDDSCLEALKVQAKAASRGRGEGDNRLSEELDGGSERSHSIDLLNEAISSIQQQMVQLSLQQDLLMKHVASPSPATAPVSVSPPLQEHTHQGGAAHVSPPPASPPPPSTPSPPSTSESRRFAVHFVDIGNSGGTPARRPPKLSSSQRRRGSERKQSVDSVKLSPQGKTSDEDQKEASGPERSLQRNSTFRVQEGLSSREGVTSSEGVTSREAARREAEESESSSGTAASPSQVDKSDVADAGKDALCGGDNARVKGQLIEVDLSELREPAEDGAADAADGPDKGEQRNVLGFFFKVCVCMFVFAC